jgi:hypothetical protein
MIISPLATTLQLPLQTTTPSHQSAPNYEQDGRAIRSSKTEEVFLPYHLLRPSKRERVSDTYIEENPLLPSLLQILLNIK